MKAMFLCLPHSPNVHTLKFSNNGFTHAQFSLLVDYLNADNCTVQHLFFDWNALHEDSYDSTDQSTIALYQKKAEDEQSLFAKLIQNNTKLQVLFLRADGIDDDIMKEICDAMKGDAQGVVTNKTLKVLDVSYNKITSKSIEYIAEMLETNRALEYLGLAKNNLCNEDAR